MYLEYTPYESQKQQISEHVEVQICLEFNLASMYLANSCAHLSVTFECHAEHKTYKER